MSDKLTEGGVRAQLAWANANTYGEGTTTEVPLDYFENLTAEWFDLTKQRDALRAALEGAAQEAHRLKQTQPPTMPVPARHHQADSFVECPDGGCPKHAQALAGQPDSQAPSPEGKHD